MATAFRFDSSLTLNFQQQAAAATVSGGKLGWKRVLSTRLQAAGHLASAGVADYNKAQKADGECNQCVVLLILKKKY